MRPPDHQHPTTTLQSSVTWFDSKPVDRFTVIRLDDAKSMLLAFGSVGVF